MKIKSFMCVDPNASGDFEKGAEKFSKELAEAINSKPVKKVILDLRGNTGGMPQPAQELMSYFISKPLFWFSVRSLEDKTSTQLSSQFVQPKKLTQPLKFLKTAPLWLLVDGGCFSQCSILTIAAKLGGRGKLIGQPIDPGAGSVLSTMWNAPSGTWSLSVPPWITLAQDGQFIEGYPLKLDIETKPAFSLFQTEADPVLRNALQKIQ